MLFCPTCGNLLLIEKVISTHRFYCKTCPYICNINQKLKNFTKFQKKQVDSVFGGKETWENVSKTTINCPNKNCSSTEAYYRQIQIRSADEPSTLFYKCVGCLHDWREG
jgi:DNA-directed RNA polymerase III subunit RPC11